MNIDIERPARRLNSTQVFRVSKCHEQNIIDLLRRHKVQEFKVEPVLDLSPQFDESYDEEIDTGEIDFDVIEQRYLSNEEIDTYTDKIAELIESKNPKVRAKVKTEGHSFEIRPIKSVTVKYKGKKNPIVMIDAGIHAREWHSRSLALYILKQLANEAENDSNGLIYNTTFLIIPDVNPDGYEYSRINNKMWRKTRKPINDECIGTDGNMC